VKTICARQRAVYPYVSIERRDFAKKTHKYVAPFSSLWTSRRIAAGHFAQAASERLADRCSAYLSACRLCTVEAVVARLHVATVLGTRPEAIKLAPVIAELRRRTSEFRSTVCFTGQHDELFWPIARYFDISPDVELEGGKRGATIAESAARMLAGLDALLDRLVPDCVLAQGDTTSVLATALAAFYRRMPFVHVEAGLRTGNLAAPWPEEMNRRVATLATTLHCAPTPRAVQNLLAEGVADGDIVLTGNTVVDALLATVRRERNNRELWAGKYAMLGSRPMVLVTGHRRENQGAGLRAVCQAIRTLSEQCPNVAFLYPVHANPQVQQPVAELLGGRANVYQLPPVGYPEFVWLMDRSTLIVTDSGGVQEEAPSLGRPLLITRTCTERNEAVECGTAVLVGTDSEKIAVEARRILDGERKLSDAVKNPYGDGSAARRIVDALAQRFSSN
jgi:UDP-N-acetylglucosamine 2-epimerase (non-hydrolysing)